jgi:hypothetical protein
MEQGFTGETAAENGRYRRLDLGKIITGSFNIYKRHFGPLVFFFLLLNIPVLFVFMRYSYLINWAQTYSFGATGTATLPPETDWAMVITLSAGLLAYLVLLFPFFLLVPARLAGMEFMGKRTTVGECASFARRGWWMAQASYAMFGAIVIALYLLPLMVSALIFIPGMELVGTVAAVAVLIFVSLAVTYLVLRVTPLSAAICFDKPTGSFYNQARSRLVHSFRLTRGTFGYVFGVMIVTYLLMAVARYVLVTPLEWLLMLGAMAGEKGGVSFLSLSFWKPPVWYTSAEITIRMLGAVVATPFVYIVASLLYFKEEGLDMELNLARALDAEADDEAVVGANTTL